MENNYEKIMNTNATNNYKNLSNKKDSLTDQITELLEQEKSIKEQIEKFGEVDIYELDNEQYKEYRKLQDNLYKNVKKQKELKAKQENIENTLNNTSEMIKAEKEAFLRDKIDDKLAKAKAEKEQCEAKLKDGTPAERADSYNRIQELNALISVYNDRINRYNDITAKESKLVDSYTKDIIKKETLQKDENYYNEFVNDPEVNKQIELQELKADRNELDQKIKGLEEEKINEGPKPFTIDEIGNALNDPTSKQNGPKPLTGEDVNHIVNNSKDITNNKSEQTNENDNKMNLDSEPRNKVNAITKAKDLIKSKLSGSKGKAKTAIIATIAVVAGMVIAPGVVMGAAALAGGGYALNEFNKGKKL